jgi:hypothetical protein
MSQYPQYRMYPPDQHMCAVETERTTGVMPWRNVIIFAASEWALENGARVFTPQHGHSI